MQIGDVWQIVAFATAAVFGAGQLVAKIRNGKYVKREICAIRVEQEHEIQGLDLSMHGEEGYILES